MLVADFTIIGEDDLLGGDLSEIVGFDDFMGSKALKRLSPGARVAARSEGVPFTARKMAQVHALDEGRKMALLHAGERDDPRRPPHSMFGRIGDRTRVALPVQPSIIQPGCTATVTLMPQRCMRGPYWLGMTGASHLSVLSLRFGNVCAFNSSGEVPGSFFDVDQPDRLIPIAGQTLNVGNTVAIELRNRECFTVETLVTLWGNDLDELDDFPAEQTGTRSFPGWRSLPAPRACPGLPALASCSIEALQAATCPACGQAMCGFALAERFRRRATKAEDRLIKAEDRLIEAQRQIGAAEEAARAE